MRIRILYIDDRGNTLHERKSRYEEMLCHNCRKLCPPNYDSLFITIVGGTLVALALVLSAILDEDRNFARELLDCWRIRA